MCVTWARDLVWGTITKIQQGTAHPQHPSISRHESIDHYYKLTVYITGISVAFSSEANMVHRGKEHMQYKHLFRNISV